jgi:hypothetical protein
LKKDDDQIVDVEWSKQEGAADRAKHQKQINKNTLIIEALLPMDLGTYVCIASKANGERAQNEITFMNHADHGAYFNYKVKGPSETVVFEKETFDEKQQPQPEDETSGQSQNNNDNNENSDSVPIVKIISNDRVYKTEGESLELLCQVTGSPRPTIKWTDGTGNDLAEKHQVTNDASVSNIIIMKITYYQ